MATILRSLLAPQPRLQVVATRGSVPSQQTGGGGTNYTLTETRALCEIGRSAASDIVYAFCGFYANSTGDADNNVTAICQSGLERSSLSPAKFYRAYVGGVSSWTLPIGVGAIFTDPFGVSLDAGEAFYVQASSYVNSTEILSTANYTGTGSQAFASTLGSGSSQVGTVGTWSSSSRTQTYTFGPIAILGVPQTPMPAVYILGDSIADGSGESSSDAGGNVGFVARGMYRTKTGLTYSIPYVKATRSGSVLYLFESGDYERRTAMARYCTHAIVALGTNDATGRTLGQLQSASTKIWTALKNRGLRVYHSNLIPRTTSTDSWATLANQTPVSGFGVGGVRDQYNSWLLTKVTDGTIDGVIDVAAQAQDSGEPNKWKVTGAANYATADGVHPTSTIHDLMAGAVATTAATFEV